MVEIVEYVAPVDCSSRLRHHLVSTRLSSPIVSLSHSQRYFRFLFSKKIKMVQEVTYLQSISLDPAIDKWYNTHTFCNFALHVICNL